MREYDRNVHRSSYIVPTHLYIPTVVKCILLSSHIETSCILDRAENTFGGVHTTMMLCGEEEDTTSF